MRKQLFGSLHAHNNNSILYLSTCSWKNQLLKRKSIIKKRLKKNSIIHCNSSEPRILDKPEFNNNKTAEDLDTGLENVWKRIREYGSSTESAPEKIDKPLKINIDLLIYRSRQARIRANLSTNIKNKRELLKEAESGFLKAMKMDPTDGRAYVSLGRLLVQQRRYKEAKELYEDGCAATGKNAFVWTSWANLELKLRNIKKSRQLFDAAIVADKTHDAAWHGWGMLEMSMKNYEKARDYWTNGIKNATIQPSPYLYQSLALLAKELNKIEEAKEWFKKGIGSVKKQDSYALYQGWAEMETELGNEEEAIELYKTTLELKPKCGYTFLAWAMLEKKLGRLNKARELLEKGHNLNRTDPALLQALAILEAEMGHVTKARYYFQKSLKIDSLHIHAWQAWGVMEYRIKKIEEARRIFQQGIWADPLSKDTALIFQAWGVLEANANNVGLARELFKCALKLNKKNDIVWETWIAMEENLGAYSRANELRNVSMQETMDVLLPSNFSTLPNNQAMLKPFLRKIYKWMKKIKEDE